MKHGFIKAGTAVPHITLAAPMHNADEINRLIDKAYDENVSILVFPRLSLTGASCGDIFFTDTLLRQADEALDKVREHTEGKNMLVFTGLPVKTERGVRFCAAALSDGRICGIIPERTENDEISFYRHNGVMVQSSPDFVLTCDELPDLSVTCVQNDDFRDAPEASVVVSLCSDPELVGRDEWRRNKAAAVSGSRICAVLRAGAGEDESSTDSVCSGHCLIASNGDIIAEAEPFSGKELLTAVIDLQHLAHDRQKTDIGVELSDSYFSLEMKETDISGIIKKRPFIPEDMSERRKTCARILDIQSRGLARRIKAAHAGGCVVALSGGLDSTLALIVTVRAMDYLGMDRKKITSVTMPCFGTTTRTRSNAESLAEAYETSFRCIDIKEAVDIHFRDIGHDPENLSVVYENAQARERTQIIMDIANADNSLVIGTGDLSELALGWATYNGDHMSNYGVNGGVPKTLIRAITAYCADEADENGKPGLASVLRDILATPVSPELLPAASESETSQKTEDIVGPYDLHDFFLYHYVRWGEEPDKIFREAVSALGDEYGETTIRKWLESFFRRFYSQQFKRSALPDGPAVGTVALSPRGAWMMPSDAVSWEIKF